MARASLVPFALAFLTGIASDLYGFALPAIAAATLVALTLRPVPRAVRASICAALASGTLDAHVFAHASPQIGDVRGTRFTATVLESRPLATGDRVETTLRLEDGSRALVYVAGAAPPAGTRLQLRGKREPFDEARNPGEPSPRALEAEIGIRWRIAHAHVLARAPPDRFDATLWLPRARAWASAHVHAALPEPDATILAGALWGERGALPPDLRGEFQDTGTVHVLVTAGLHLGVVAALAVALLQIAGCGRVSASLGTIAVVWLYAAFSGAHLPSLRAATMLSFGLLARACGREALSWNALAAAAIVVAAVRPASVASLSFALSFSCVAAIFAFAEPVAFALERCGLPRTLREALAVSVATQLGTWPLTAAGFLVIAPYAPLANVAIVPAVAVAMLGGCVLLATAPVPAAASLAANIETSLLDWIVGVVRFAGALPGAHVVATPPPSWTIATYDVAVAAAAYALARSRRAVAIATMLAASALCLWPPHAHARGLSVTAIDVGQADALLIRTPGGHAYLVDAGGRLERGASQSADSAAEDVGRRIVVPFLIRQGIHHLDAVLLSHPHGDHAGGIAPALRTLGANAFADSGQRYAGHAYRDALAVANARHVPLLEPRGGDTWRTADGVTFRFYGPTDPFISGSRNDINNNSLVFRLEYGRFRMLFTGDAGAETEARLLRRGFGLRAAVLKVGHHGSAYGTTPAFVRAVGPRAAIVSVGRNNLFGHPAASTIATLDRYGARVYRTDEDGAVTITSDGSADFAVTPFLARDRYASALTSGTLTRTSPVSH